MPRFLQRALASEIVEPAVNAVMPKSTSPDVVATAIGCTASKNISSTSRPASEVALVLRDEHRRRQRQPQHAYFGFQEIIGVGEATHCNSKQAGRCEPRKSHHQVSSAFFLSQKFAATSQQRECAPSPALRGGGSGWGCQRPNDGAERCPHPPRSVERVDLPRKRERCAEQAAQFLTHTSELYSPSGTGLIAPDKRPLLASTAAATFRPRSRAAPYCLTAPAPPRCPPLRPSTKQAPETRAADWPSWVIEAQRPATSRLSTPAGTSMRYGNSLNRATAESAET